MLYADTLRPYYVAVESMYRNMYDSILAVLHGRVGADRSIYTTSLVFGSIVHAVEVPETVHSVNVPTASLRLSSWFASGNATRSLLIIEILSIWMAYASP